ncbi:MAG: HpcH/HpaI aldolase/citrate lyase family protein [Gaiellales bacterium]
MPIARSLPRSFLYVPATQPGLFGKASSGGSDAVVLDLEDAVPLARKSQARAHVGDWLDAPDESATAEQWVRLNAESVAEDLAAVVHPNLRGLFVAKCSVPTLEEVSGELRTLERRRGLAEGSVGLIGLVESAEALLSLQAMASSPRLCTFGLGEVDLLADLRMSRQVSDAALDTLRTQVVLHCASAQLRPPVAPTSVAFRELDQFRASTRHLFELGFRSRTAIHPNQVSVIHEVLTPDDDTVWAAHDVVERYTSAGGGVTTDADGRLIDAAVVREAQEILCRRGLA